MPAKGFLSLEKKQHLQEILKQSQRAEVRERVLILLLMNDGRTQEEIAAVIGCSRRTIAYWCVHGDPDKIESLEDGRRKREYRKATQEYLDKLIETVEKEPSDLGYEFGRWTGERLATYLEEQTGIKLTASQVRKILQRKKYVYLWAKYSLEDERVIGINWTNPETTPLLSGETLMQMRGGRPSLKNKAESSTPQLIDTQTDNLIQDSALFFAPHSSSSNLYRYRCRQTKSGQEKGVSREN